jgi:hypothetical protein
MTVYTDARGRRQRLTREQRGYLDVARQYHHVAYGWGGYRSTLTVRILHERGLLSLSTNHHAGVRWCITGITPLGETVLKQQP